MWNDNGELRNQCYYKEDKLESKKNFWFNFINVIIKKMRLLKNYVYLKFNYLN